MIEGRLHRQLVTCYVHNTPSLFVQRHYSKLVIFLYDTHFFKVITNSSYEESINNICNPMFGYPSKNLFSFSLKSFDRNLLEKL